MSRSGSSPARWEIEYIKLKKLKNNVDAVLHEQLRILSLLNAATLLHQAKTVDVRPCIDIVKELIAEVPYFEAEEGSESLLVAFHRLQQQRAAGVVRYRGPLHSRIQRSASFFTCAF